MTVTKDPLSRQELHTLRYVALNRADAVRPDDVRHLALRGLVFEQNGHWRPTSLGRHTWLQGSPSLARVGADCVRAGRAGVRASVVRPARSVHGVGERHGFVPQLADIAREKGFSAYVRDGQSPWPAVHRLDAARVFRLAIERGAGGEAYHAVAEGVPFRLMAEAIGRQLGMPTRSLALDEAEVHFGTLAIWLTGSGTVSSEWTRDALGWTLRETGLIQDIDRPQYYG